MRAFHLCVRDKADSRKPRRAILNIAFQLSECFWPQAAPLPPPRPPFESTQSCPCRIHACRAPAVFMPAVPLPSSCLPAPFSGTQFEEFNKSIRQLPLKEIVPTAREGRLLKQLVVDCLREVRPTVDVRVSS